MGLRYWLSRAGYMSVIDAETEPGSYGYCRPGYIRIVIEIPDFEVKDRVLGIEYRRHRGCMPATRIENIPVAGMSDKVSLGNQEVFVLLSGGKID